MASYGYNSYESNTGEYNWTPYAYDVVPFHPSFTYSSSEFHEPEPEFIEYYPNTYYNRYDSSQVEINYSAYSFTDPKAISYNLCSQTQYLISYSTSEFNEPEFVEYDPTPYDGGYDLALTYGKPLPPSDDICYPRTTPTSDDLSLDKFSYASIPSPYGKEGLANDSSEKPLITIKPTDVSEGGTESDDETGDEDGDGSNGLALVGPIEDLNQGEEGEGYTYANYDYDYPWSGYDYDYGCGNGRNGWCAEETSYGYGSDTVEICESLFGYWPCLSRERENPSRDKYNRGFGSGGGSESNPWNQTADYLFGYQGRYNANGSYNY